MSRPLTLSHDVVLESAPGSLLLARALEEPRKIVRVVDWLTVSAELPEELGMPVLQVELQGRRHALYEHGDTLVAATLMPGHVGFALAARDEEQLAVTVDRLKELFPPPEPSATHEVPVTFWTYGPHGPMPSWRSIAVPGWEDVRDNYPDHTRARLEPLMAGFRPARGGQLILWHGRAGTGKTYALRALAWEWKDWCEFHYIVDPDAFFGQHADYLMNVLLQPAWDQVPPHVAGVEMRFEDLGVAEAELGQLEGAGAGERSKAWKLLMLEDTGELLTADARAVIGQGLSRFLNVVDGMIGQGLRVLVLVTTNEEIRKLHPAVARPGRCAANVDFVPIPVDQANGWLALRGSDATVDQPATLASLFATAEGLDAGSPVIEAGFAG